MPDSGYDFTPVHGDAVEEVSLRPSLSYWHDVWRRLRGNRRATVSLFAICGLLLASLLGPVVWPVDPSQQDLGQLSRPPFADRRVRLVGPYETWRNGPAKAAEGAGLDLRLAEDATTRAVRLLWSPDEDAAGYRVYRHIEAISVAEPKGLPLAEILDGAVSRYEDRLDLEARTYFYTVAALDAAGSEIRVGETLAVDVERVLPVDEAVKRGFADANAKPGDVISLPWHPFGTDALGRDMLARLIHGSRVSLFIGFGAPLFYLLVGIVFGSLAGLIGGRFDDLAMRFTDFVVALPFLLFMILFKIAFGIGPGESGVLPMLVAMILLSWPASTRLVRGQILQLREEGYIEAARLMGAPLRYVILRHIVPNILGVVLVTLTFAIPGAIFTEAFLSFIGMGVVPPTPSWGSMCNDGIKTMLTHPHELALPALVISATVLAFNLLGDGLRDALDTRMRGRE